LHKTAGPGSHGQTVTGCNNEYYEKWDELKQIPEVSLVIVMGANSPEEHAYQVKVLDRILADTGGKITPLGETAMFKNRDFVNMIKACFVPRTAFRASGSFMIDGMVAHGTVDNCAMGIKMDAGLREKYIKKGVIGDDGTYNSWGTAFEGSHMALFECGHFFDPLDEESTNGMAQMADEGVEICLKTPFNLCWGTFGGLAVGTKRISVGPLCYNFTDWMRKIKRVFDPNSVSDLAGYISPEEK
jgi:hypothetical protein